MRFAVAVAVALGWFAFTGHAAAAPFAVGSGDEPGLAVDPAGTAYIAWHGPEAGTTSLQFCRLPRGATTCEGQRVIAAEGTSLSRPFVQVDGSTVRIVQYRYGLPAPQPFGQTFVFTSTDRGGSFGPGRGAGEANFHDAVFGTDGTVTGVTSADSNGGLAQRLSLTSGTVGRSWAQLFPSSAGYNGTIGYTPTGQRLAIFTAGVADASLRLHSGGDPNVESSWGAAVPMGYADYPRLAAGAPGLFVLAGDAAGNMFVRRWNGAGFDAPVTIGPGDASESHLFVDPGGRLHAVYPRLDAQFHHLQHSVSDNGVTWQSGSAAVQTDDQEGAARVAAAADHVGVAVWSSRGAGGREIRVSAIGPGAPVAPAPPPVGPPAPTAPPPVPEFGRTVVVQPTGTVRLRLRGSSRFVTLSSLDDVPIGATLDTKRGSVALSARTRRNGPVETIRLSEGWFRIGQSGNVTTFTLNEPLARCARRASASARRKPKTRRLWGDGKGAFRTTGTFSAATVRGTRWLTRDSCAGTLTRVTQGSVAVRDKVRKRTVVVRAGRSYTARPRR